MRDEIHGQRGRPFVTRFQEHLRDYIYANNRSKFAQNLLENKHAIGTMEIIMDTIHITSKVKMINTLERFYIYRETRYNTKINDKVTVKANENSKL
jgi:hypothetical protein